MEHLIITAIGIGLVTSLAFTELLGVAAGGMVVPGYMAVYLDRPLTVALTIGAAYLTWFVVQALGTVAIVYGRRRTVLMILVGFLLGALVRGLGPVEMASGPLDLNLVGYIIPGLIAIWIDRQGLLETITSLVTASVVVRLVLVLVFAGELAP